MFSLQIGAKDKRGSFTKIDHRQIEVRHDFGFAIFAPDLFDCFTLRVGALLDEQLLITGLSPFLADRILMRKTDDLPVHFLKATALATRDDADVVASFDKHQS